MIRQDALEDFWEDLARAAHAALLLDYDGTLAPFCVDRDRAYPYPGIRARLAALLQDTDSRLVIISGRAVSDLVPLLNLDPLPEIWGCHGWEKQTPAGEREVLELPAAARADLDRAAEDLHQAGLDSVAERKPASLAVHWRGLDNASRQRLDAQVRRLWEPLVSSGPLQLHGFDGGLELRCPGRDKGRVIRDIRTELDAATAVAFLGDDLTDEDGFVALGAAGLSVLVRDTPRRTAARAVLRPPDELLEFLDRWYTIRHRKGEI